MIVIPRILISMKDSIREYGDGDEHGDVSSYGGGHGGVYGPNGINNVVNQSADYGTGYDDHPFLEEWVMFLKIG